MGASTSAGKGKTVGRRGRRRAGAGGAPMAEINVTPFVDVMLVLLVIFMVAAPLLTAGVPVNLPETAAKPLPLERKPPTTVTVDGAGRVFLGEEEVSLADLPARVGERIEDPEADSVYIRADGAIDYATVFRVMNALHEGGFRKLGFVGDLPPAPAPATPEG